MGLRGWQLSALSTNKGFSLLHSKVSIFKTVQPPETTRVSGTHSLLCNWWGTCWLTLLGDTVRTLLLFLMFPRVAPLTVQPRQLHMHTWKHTNRQIRFLLLFKIKSQWKPQKKKEKYISAEFMKVPFSVVFLCLSEREEKSKAVRTGQPCLQYGSTGGHLVSDGSTRYHSSTAHSNPCYVAMFNMFLQGP